VVGCINRVITINCKRLSENTGVTSVGGAMWPIGETRDQQFVVDLIEIPTSARRRQLSKSTFLG